VTTKVQSIFPTLDNLKCPIIKSAEKKKNAPDLAKKDVIIELEIDSDDEEYNSKFSKKFGRASVHARVLARDAAVAVGISKVEV
jgi:hypothetical protein